MATYLELMDQAHQLMAEAEQVRQREIDSVIADIRAKMQTYGLSADDISGSRAKGRRAGQASARTPTAVKYRGPNGETWSGGRGRRPKWIQDAIAAGKSLDDFLV